jgi:hypothetical protein
MESEQEYTLVDVLRALEEADKAGNKEDAQELADIARSMMSESDKLDASSGGMMPFVNKAIAQTVETPAKLAFGASEVLRKGINLVLGVDIQKPELALDFAQRGLRATGLEIPSREPRTLKEFVGRGVGDAVGYLNPTTFAAQRLSSGPRLINKISNEINKTIVKHPLISGIGEITAGAGAGTGRAAGENLFPESPALQSTSEMAGAVLGGMSPAMIRNAPLLKLIAFGKHILRRIRVPFSKEGSKFRAGEGVKGQVADPQKAISEIDAESIADLPPAVKSGEKRIIELYKSIAMADPVAEADVVEKLGKEIMKLEATMRKLGYGSPELLAEITQKRISALELQMDTRVMKALDNAQSSLDKIPVANRKSAESRIVRNEIDRVRVAESKKVDALWEDVPKDIEVNPSLTRETYNDFKTDLPESQLDDIPQVLKDSFILKKNYKGKRVVNIKEINGLRSKLLEIARQAGAEKKWNKARIANNMADAILQDIGIVADDVTKEGAKQLQLAMAGTRRLKERFEQGVVGKLLGYAKTGEGAIDPDLTLELSIGRMKERGAVDINKIAITPEGRKATERYLGRSFTDSVINKKTGEIDPTKANQWIKNNEAILDNFPEFRKLLSNAQQAQDLANRTRTLMNTRKAKLKNPKISRSAKFLNSADLNTTAETVFKSKGTERIRLTKEIVRQARKDPSGDAIGGIRASFIDYMMEKTSTHRLNEFAEKTLSGRDLSEFIKKNRGVLHQVFEPQQILRMERVAKELSKAETFSRVRAGSPEIELKDFASNALQLFSRWGGARIGGWIGKGSAGGSIQSANMMSERAKLFTTRLTKDRAVQLINDAIISDDPTLLKALLGAIDKPNTKLGEKNIKVLDEKLNAWLMGTGQRVYEDILSEINEEQSK